MQAHVVDAIMDEFKTLANGHRTAADKNPFLVDVYLKGSASEKPHFSGTLHRPQRTTGVVEMDLYQYGHDNDFGRVVIACEDIAALRMRKPL